MIDAAQQAREAEDAVLSEAVKVALHTFMRICTDDSLSEELQIDAASRILGYASTFQPEVNIDLTPGGDDEDDGDSDEAEPGDE